LILRFILSVELSHKLSNCLTKKIIIVEVPLSHVKIEHPFTFRVVTQ
jgi:hypothetical protein